MRIARRRIVAGRPPAVWQPMPKPSTPPSPPKRQRPGRRTWRRPGPTRGYLMEKERREKEEREQKARAQAAKEQGVAKLQAEHRRVLDAQGELDALRARRAQEQRDREWRAKELEEADRNAAKAQELRAARESQQQEREARIAAHAQREHEDAIAVAEAQRAADVRAAEQRARDRARHEAHQTAVLQQVQSSEEARRQQRETKLAEGRKLAAERAAREAELESIRQRKLLDMGPQQTIRIRALGSPVSIAHPASRIPGLPPI
eukprot:TRINITY_DN498_c0_g2_i1.p2 TRINITY_DN498_c0_g2~~TRINITY_DN498_c0_g2_i1.p2  ORF type:complete len:262 (+),score=38.18 TRINITY_DN498_c0_g2_i1:652-1437(+)